MSEWSYYLDDPNWRAAYFRAHEPMNGVIFPRWIQGSVGGTTPMHLWSNEYGYNYMKFGTNFGVNAYAPGVQPFSPLVTGQLQNQVKDCNLKTSNPGGCQMAAVQQIFTDTATTPHPFGVSYRTGRSPYTWPVKPTGKIP